LICQNAENPAPIWRWVPLIISSYTFDMGGRCGDGNDDDDGIVEGNSAQDDHDTLADHDALADHDTFDAHVLAVQFPIVEFVD
jgi:hypothetical protein